MKVKKHGLKKVKTKSHFCSDFFIELYKLLNTSKVVQYFEHYLKTDTLWRLNMKIIPGTFKVYKQIFTETVYETMRLK